MATRLQVLLPITAAAIVVGIMGIMTIPSDVKLEAAEFPIGTVKIDNIVLEVQIADTDPTRMRGLMFQEELPYDKGMLFVFDNLGIRPMWMLNMQFPLDLIWFDSNGNVVHIEKNIPPCKSALETVTCTVQNAENKHAQYILEVTSGFVDEFNISEDSKLEIIST